MDSILFDGVNNPETLEDVVGQAVGAASMCWESTEDRGKFKIDMARQLVDDVVEWINRNYVRVTQEPPSTYPTPDVDIARVVNYYSLENGSNTPDWILARLMLDVKFAFDKATNARTKWYENPEDSNG